MTASEPVELQREGSVGVMVWRHEEQNRFTTPFLRAVREGLAELAADDAVRGVVIASGLERCWCTGLHLAWIMGESARDPSALATFLESLHHALLEVTGLGRPSSA